MVARRQKQKPKTMSKLYYNRILSYTPRTYYNIIIIIIRLSYSFRVRRGGVGSRKKASPRAREVCVT